MEWGLQTGMRRICPICGAREPSRRRLRNHMGIAHNMHGKEVVAILASSRIDNIKKEKSE